MPEEILVIPRSILFAEKQFEGFCPISEKNFLNTILACSEYKERAPMEINPEFQQPIPYVWIINPKTRRVFIYKRSGGGGEGRLHNKYSGGVGGHIDKITEAGSRNPIADAMMRELKEEVAMTNYPTPKFVGFINDDSNEVGQVHFGVVAIAETEEPVRPIMHMAEGDFQPIEEIEKIFSDPNNNIEPWTQISWPFVKSYVESLPH